MTNVSIVPTVKPPVPALPELPEEAVLLHLSQILRADTKLAHQDVEIRLALPGSIGGLPDYQRCLLRFYQLYSPLETRFESFPDWIEIGLDPPNRSLSKRLASDLRTLGVSVPEIRDAPPEALPTLQTFAQALGACYVIEGSALGSQFMLPQLQQVLGAAMTGADSFFRGRGTETSAFWKKFRAALDLYGDIHPRETPSVVSGAIATFEAVGKWMAP